MNLETACTFQSRLLFRISHEPTASARTLRTVIQQHGPVEHPDRPGEAMCAGAFYPGPERGLRDGRTCMDGTVDDGPAPYPCATQQTIALELGVPLPAEPTYGTGF
jgi:hypothetical protein